MRYKTQLVFVSLTFNRTQPVIKLNFYVEVLDFAKCVTLKSYTPSHYCK